MNGLESHNPTGTYGFTIWYYSQVPEWDYALMVSSTLGNTDFIDYGWSSTQYFDLHFWFPIWIFVDRKYSRRRGQKVCILGTNSKANFMWRISCRKFHGSYNTSKTSNFWSIVSFLYPKISGIFRSTMYGKESMNWLYLTENYSEWWHEGPIWQNCQVLARSDNKINRKDTDNGIVEKCQIPMYSDQVQQCYHMLRTNFGFTMGRFHMKGSLKEAVKFCKKRPRNAPAGIPAAWELYRFAHFWH